MSVQVTGVDEFMRQLEQLTITPEAAKKAVSAAADLYCERLLPNIPETDGRGHHVRDELTYKPGQYPDGSTDVGFTKAGYYARFPNNGTAKQPAQHFMEHTFDETKDAMQQVMIDMLKRGEG